MKNYSAYSDQEIIEAIRSGDERGYKAIFINRTATLKRYVRSNGGNAQDADNIEQKTILILYEKIISDTFKLNPNTRLSTFLYSIGRNLSSSQSGSDTDTQIDKATVEQANVQLSDHAKLVRANHLGFEAKFGLLS